MSSLLKILSNFVVYYLVRFNTQDFFFYTALKGNYLLKHLEDLRKICNCWSRKNRPKIKVLLSSSIRIHRWRLEIFHLTTSVPILKQADIIIGNWYVKKNYKIWCKIGESGLDFETSSIFLIIITMHPVVWYWCWKIGKLEINSHCPIWREWKNFFVAEQTIDCHVTGMTFDLL